MALFKTTANAVQPAVFRVGCEACALSAEWPKLDNPRLEPRGNDSPLAYFIGDKPDAASDGAGTPFAGAAGNYLTRELRQWDNDGVPYRVSNVLRCRPPGDRDPKESETTACFKGHLLADLVAANPSVVVALGAVAMNQFMYGSIHEWNGVSVPVRLGDTTAWLMPMLHPSYFLEKDNDPDHLVIWKARLAAMRKSIVGRERPYIPTKEEIFANIQLLTTVEVRSATVIDLFSGSDIAVDLETQGLMPWEKGARILSVSVSNGATTVAWLIDHPENPAVEESLALLLTVCRHASRIIAQNAVFEQRWLAAAFGMEVFGWQWCDTMARQFAQFGMRLQRLGAQTMLYYGFDVKEMSAVDPVYWYNYSSTDLLTYNALDAKWTYRIWQEPLPDWAVVEVTRQGRATVAAAAISWRGMVVDAAELGRQSASLEKAISTDIKKISLHSDVIDFEMKTRTRFNPASPDQVAKYFELQSADEEALRDIDDPLAKMILRLRKLEKLLTTYAQGIQKTTYEDGCLHPDFSTMRTVTGRWSSQKPNAQNMPKRENKELRKVVIPPRGYGLVSFDFKQLEAIGCAISANDSTMLTYVWNEVDIHREWAIELVDRWPEVIDRICPKTRDDKTVIARARGEIKNGFVFPLIYGAGVKKCAGQLQVPMKVVQEMEQLFFRKYAGVKKWQTTMHEFYAANFFVETMTKRRRFGPVSWTEQLNTPIQGTGSDIVVDASIQLTEMAVESNDICYIPMVNIHDDLSFYLPLRGMEKYIENIARIMVTPRYGWITTPLAVEVTVGRANWSEQDEFRTYKTGDFYPLPKTGLVGQVKALQSIARRNPRDSFNTTTSWAHTAVSEQRAETGPNAARRARAVGGAAPVRSASPNQARRERLALKPLGRVALTRTATP